METRPTKLTIIAWFSIIIGLFSISGSGGYLVVAIMSDAPIRFGSEYQVILQFITSLLIMLGGAGVLLGKPMSQKILLVSYGLLAFLIVIIIGKYAFGSRYGTGDKIVFIVNFLFMLAPVIFVLLVLRSDETKSYFADIET